MRSLLVACSFVALLTTAGCGDEPDPDDIPHTVPPASAPTVLREGRRVRGVGPIIETRAVPPAPRSARSARG